MVKHKPTDPGPNRAIIRTTRALVCTSDSHTVGGGIGPRENLTIGHETVGVVDQLGSEKKHFQSPISLYAIFLPISRASEDRK